MFISTKKTPSTDKDTWETWLVETDNIPEMASPSGIIDLKVENSPFML